MSGWGDQFEIVAEHLSALHGASARATRVRANRATFLANPARTAGGMHGGSAGGGRQRRDVGTGEGGNAVDDSRDEEEPGTISIDSRSVCFTLPEGTYPGGSF